MQASQTIEMGTIICQHCHRVIETFETEKVITYFGVCQEEDCIPADRTFFDE